MDFFSWSFNYLYCNIYFIQCYMDVGLVYGKIHNVICSALLITIFLPSPLLPFPTYSLSLSVVKYFVGYSNHFYIASWQVESELTLLCQWGGIIQN